MTDPGDGRGRTAAPGETVLLVNPAAGRGRGARAAAPAEHALRAAGHRVRRAVGRDAADAARLAREAVAGGAAALVAVGGDGMAGLALQAVAGTAVPLGIVPAGSGNDFARALGLPLGDPAAAARTVAAGRTRTVDLGRREHPGGDERWFGTVLASGLDSRVNDRVNRMRWPSGRTRYNLALLAELARLRPITYLLELDGAVHELHAVLIAVGNATSYGGGMRICADAELDDGLFDITVVKPLARRTLVRLFPSVYRGTHLALPQVRTFRAARVSLKAEGLTGYADGEPLGELPLTVRCVPGALRVLC